MTTNKANIYDEKKCQSVPVKSLVFKYISVKKINKSEWKTYNIGEYKILLLNILNTVFGILPKYHVGLYVYLMILILSYYYYNH